MLYFSELSAKLIEELKRRDEQRNEKEHKMALVQQLLQQEKVTLLSLFGDHQTDRTKEAHKKEVLICFLQQSEVKINGDVL